MKSLFKLHSVLIHGTSVFETQQMQTVLCAHFIQVPPIPLCPELRLQAEQQGSAMLFTYQIFVVIIIILLLLLIISNSILSLPVEFANLSWSSNWHAYNQRRVFKQRIPFKQTPKFKFIISSELQKVSRMHRMSNCLIINGRSQSLPWGKLVHSEV